MHNKILFHGLFCSVEALNALSQAPGGTGQELGQDRGAVLENRSTC